MTKRKSRSSKGSPSRNEPCPCGSGKKYKRCCALKAGGTMQGSTKILIWIGGVALARLAGLRSDPDGSWQRFRSLPWEWGGCKGPVTIRTETFARWTSQHSPGNKSKRSWTMPMRPAAPAAAA